MSSTSIPFFNSEEGEAQDMTTGKDDQTGLSLSNEICLPCHLNSYTLDMSTTSNSMQTKVEVQTFQSKKELLSPNEQTGSVTSNIQPKLALARSRSQHFIGKAKQVKTEFVFADSVAEISVDLIGECVLPVINSTHIFIIREIRFTDLLALIFLVSFNSWNNWVAIPMHRETKNLWSVKVSLNRGYHEFCFLVDGTALVTSSRHKSNKSTLLPGLKELNWRNIYGPRSVAIHPVPSTPVAVLMEFLSGVGVISVHGNSYGPSSLQGSLSFPSVPSITPSAELGNESLKAKDLVMHLRIPILLLYVMLLYFSLIGLAIISGLPGNE